jgi:predicted enzyme related to lactoylglutathione lyase
MEVGETFFSLEVCEMPRATRFYVDALGASVAYESANWTSLRIAGVRVALFLHPEHAAAHVGLHFVVSDLAATRALADRAGGHSAALVEVAPGVSVANVTDSEGNTFSLHQQRPTVAGGAI